MDAYQTTLHSNNDLIMMMMEFDELDGCRLVPIPLPYSFNPGHRGHQTSIPSPPRGQLEPEREYRYGPYAHDIRCPEYGDTTTQAIQSIFKAIPRRAEDDLQRHTRRRMDTVPSIEGHISNIDNTTPVAYHGQRQIVPDSSNLRQSSASPFPTQFMSGASITTTPTWKDGTEHYSDMSATPGPGPLVGQDIPPEFEEVVNVLQSLARPGFMPPLRQQLKDCSNPVLNRHFCSGRGILRQNSALLGYYGDRRMFNATWWRFLTTTKRQFRD